MTGAIIEMARSDVAKDTQMTLDQLLNVIKTEPAAVEFSDVMLVIATYYDYSAITFNNGDLVNEAGSNEGSCKIFAFAQLQQLDQAQTLACFGQYYRDDVLKHPDASDHGNIRRFIQHGWSGISVNAAITLTAK